MRSLLLRHRHFLLLFGILLVGFVLRMLLASQPGNEFDVGVNQGWGKSAVHLGLARSYTEQLEGNMLPNYAPFTLMIFTGTAYVQQWLFGFDADPLTYRILIKIPAILADLLTAAFFFFLLRRWRGAVAGLTGALVFTLHPAVIYNSAVWGQTDSIFSMFLVLGAGLYIVRYHTLSGAFVALAILSKMQAAALFPLFFILYARGGWRPLADAVLGGLIVTVPILLPFALGGTLQNVIDVYIHSVGYYSIVSSAAYNFWWSLYGDQAGTMQDTLRFFGTLSFRQIGFLLYGAGFLWTLVFLWKHLRPSSHLQSLAGVFTACAFLFHAFFMVNTQMHERYLFPFVALGVPLIFLGRTGRLLYGWIGFLFFMNLLGWLPATSIDRALYREFPALDIFIASLQVVLLLTFLRFLYLFNTTVPLPPGPPSLSSHPLDRLRKGWRHLMTRAGTARRAWGRGGYQPIHGTSGE